MCSKNELLLVTQSVVRQTLELLNDKVDRIVLYGSYARGDFTSESDVDIIILLNCSEEETEEYRMMVSKLASRIGLDHDVEVSLLLRSSSTFQKRQNVLPFYQNIQKEGIVLYLRWIGWIFQNTPEFQPISGRLI